MSSKINTRKCLHHDSQCKRGGPQTEDSISCKHICSRISSRCIHDISSIGWILELGFESCTRLIPPGWESSIRYLHYLFKGNLLLRECKRLSHQQRQCQHQYQSLWQRWRRSEYDQVMSPCLKQWFNLSGWISYFQAVCELPRATVF